VYIAHTPTEFVFEDVILVPPSVPASTHFVIHSIQQCLHQGPLQKAWLARKITVEMKYGVCKSYLDPKNITTVVIGSKYQNS
jgi:hypothetical protein